MQLAQARRISKYVHVARPIYRLSFCTHPMVVHEPLAGVLVEPPPFFFWSLLAENSPSCLGQHCPVVLLARKVEDRCKHRKSY